MDPTLPGFSCTPPCEQCTFDCALSVMGKAALRMYGLEYYALQHYRIIRQMEDILYWPEFIIG
ncbi:hypothetical protein E2C01_032647 [Portunus trituberculatus]|uniref:Uncharacterized protein n=1 Tax=Portunus trituberculatus TaxID=210409 RepID=A0A5B7F194_PORTR|nr:hypothetical protein [Portunus trituberculatus]